jgi:uncharacterized protein YcfL
MRRALAAAVVTTIALTGCANSDGQATEAPTPSESTSAVNSPHHTPSQTSSASPSESPTDAAEDDGRSVEIEIEGDRITPNGERLKLGIGETITLEIRSDRAGELHVHSTPEQMLEFDKGRTTVELTIDQPGIVDVEEHESGVVILQLQVS